MTTDFVEAQRFLTLLDPSPASVFHYQTFDDNKARKLKSLVRTGYSYGADLGALQRLAELSDNGAGVFVAINEHIPGTARQQANIKRIRALTLDLDGAPRYGVDHCPLTPSIIVESSTGKYHCYWLVDGDFPQQIYAAVQRGLAERFNGDPSIAGTQHVLRLPGFLHQKHSPRMVHIIDANGKRYTPEALLAEFPPAQMEASDSRNDPNLYLGVLDNEDVEACLSVLDPRDFDSNEPWFKLMCSVWYLSGGNAANAWAAWSAQDERYAGDRQEVMGRWRSLRRRPSNPITAAPLAAALVDAASSEAYDEETRNRAWTAYTALMDVLDDTFDKDTMRWQREEAVAWVL